jgi:hypothetical protein
MRTSLILLFLLLTAPIFASKEEDSKGTPLMRTVTPATVSVGDVVTVNGEYLDKKFVAAVYLADDTTSLEVEVLRQAKESLEFKVPAGVKPGKYVLLVLTTEVDAMLLEQPVKLRVQ